MALYSDAEWIGCQREKQSRGGRRDLLYFLEQLLQREGKVDFVKLREYGSSPTSPKKGLVLGRTCQ